MGQADEHSKTLSTGGIIDEQQFDKREDQKLAQEASAIFNMFDRIATMMRVYPKGHPLLDELGVSAAERIHRGIQQVGEIDVKIGAHALSTFYGTEFFSAESSEKGQYIWYNAYADGLQRLTFLEGVTPTEIINFLNIINKSHAGTIHSDDDTVTLLWELELKNIEYFAVEGFVDSGGLESFSNMNEQEAIETIADAAIDPKSESAKTLMTMFSNLTMVNLDVFTRMQIDSQKRMVVQELKDTDLAYAFGVDPALIEKLGTEWTAGVDLEYRLIEALLSIVRSAPTSEAATRASELIKDVTYQLLDSGLYEQARRVLELLHDRRKLFQQSEIDPLGVLIERLSDPLQLEALLHTLQKNTKARDSLVKLLLLLGPAKVLKQVLTLLADEKRKVVAIAQLVDVILAAVSTENEGQLMAPELTHSTVYFTRLLGELADRDLSAFGPAPRLIRAALATDSKEAQAAALHLKHDVFRDQVLAEKYLVPLSQQTDEELRKVAFEKLGSYHPELFKNSIRDNLLTREFKGRTHAELRFLMRIFLESSDEAPATLRSMVDLAGWFPSGHREFAKMAAAVLLENHDLTTKEIVLKRASAFWTHPDLKRSYKESLGNFAPEMLAASAPTPAQLESEPKEEEVTHE